MEVKYPGQPDDEKTLYVIQKHWAAVAPIMFASVVMLAAALGLVFYGSSHSGNITYTPIPNSTFGAAGILLATGAVFMFFGALWVWHRNRVIVTDEHIVDINQQGIFNQRVSTLALSALQDISAKIEGPMQTFLHYGTVVVQTAGEHENFVFDYIATPHQTEQRILETHNEFRAKYKTKKEENPLSSL